MSINLNAFSGRDVQNCRTLITHLQNNGSKTITDLLTALDAHQRQAEKQQTLPVCPDCGKPTWRKRRMADGIERMWCFSCTFSEEINERYP